LVIIIYYSAVRGSILFYQHILRSEHRSFLNLVLVVSGGLLVVGSSSSLLFVSVVVVLFSSSLSSLSSWLSLFSLLSWPVVSLLLLVLELSVLDIVESLPKTIFDVEDLGGGLSQEVVYFGLGLGVGLEVILLKPNLGDSLLNLFDEITESLLGGLFSTVIIDSFGCFLG